MVVCDKKLANLMGGKTARACDNCISKRARWYCPADDAFLCQGCDSSVHSANPLAHRHQRVRLKTVSMKHLSELSVPSWHRGFTKKARTPRNKKHAKPMFEDASESSSSGVNVMNRLDLVPELCSDDNSFEENDDEQLLYRVPVFEPFVQELCNDSNTNTISPQIELKGSTQSYSNPHGSLPSEMEIEEFAADVESLLGKRLDDESFDIEGLGFSDRKDHNLLQDDQRENSCGSDEMKIEVHGIDIQDHVDDGEIEMGIREPFEISFDFDSTIACEDDNYNNNNVQLVDINREISKVEEGSSMIHGKKKILLRLDYEGVLTSWDDQKSPWTTGERPELDPYGCWPVCTGSCGRVHPYGDVGMFGHPAIADGDREARVSRYREKRRTRLFSKKIRYEVRKLNAEKRPRMKGRFVKRSNLSA